MQSLVDTGHHVRVKINGLKRGDPLILRAIGTNEIRYVVYALADQVDDSRIPVNTSGVGNQFDWWVMPKTGKVSMQYMYAERCTLEEAATALIELAERKL